MTSYMLKLKALKTVDQGMAFQHVLRAPPEVELMTEAVEVLVIPVMKRRGGVMLAVPTGFFANPVLEAGFAAVQTELIGPSTTLTVPAVLEEEDGTETALGSDVEVVVIDFALAILDHVRLFDPVTEGPEIHCFYPGSPEIYPSPQLLLEAVTSWIQTASEDRVGFYTAMEEEQVAKASPKASVPAAKKGPRKVTNAVLAEQVSALADTLPVVLEQLGALQSSQEKLEGLVAQGQHQAKVPPYRQPFPQALPKFPPTAAAKFLGEIGPPPRVKAVGAPASPGLFQGEVFPGGEPSVLPCEEGYQEQLEAATAPSGEASVQRLLLQQSQALTALVAHLSSQDGLGDLGGAGSGTAISLKGSARREKLLNDLAARRGNFMLKVAQNAYRRLKPSDPVPASLQEFHGKPLFAKYLECHGGFSANRDLGLVMWLLCQVADQMIQGDVMGSMEMLALVLTSVEQAAQDGGKWEVAWLLSLQEDPPPGVFSARPASANPRLRAFSPLCPAEWAATSLSYVKELDIINSRRQEVIPGKKGKKEDDKDAPPPKRPPRTPKKPKGGGKGEEA